MSTKCEPDPAVEPRVIVQAGHPGVAPDIRSTYYRCFWCGQEFNPDAIGGYCRVDDDERQMITEANA